MVKETIVLRLGHRTTRDKRITTHCCLVARAFGAKKIYLYGEEEKEIEKTVKEVVENFGGKFKAKFENSWKKRLQKAKKQRYVVVHLTMYGELLEKKQKEIKKEKKIAVVVGAGKVPKEVYKKADYNIAVESQPHSEVGALAVFLHKILEKKERKNFSKAKKIIIPQKAGKKVKTV